jgi:crotonobetainyl-CoA:carnitine CoA-transferase CaiB-like acyl-CoA transferase
VSGPLSGIRVLEVGGIGPGPFAGMILADLGAEVLRVDRPNERDSSVRALHRVLLRGRRSIALDLKDPRGRDLLLELVDGADALTEGFRPGVMERLGLGPEPVLARNPRLVYGRMTGWGQDGPWAQSAGHDINYIAVAGALEPLAAPDLTPTPPLNMLGDYSCVSEVVEPAAVLTHPQLAARGTYLVADGLLQPAPAPRFSATPPALPPPASEPGTDTLEILTELGTPPEHIRTLLAAGVLGLPAADSDAEADTSHGGAL